MATLGQLIKQQRERSGMSQQELASAAGLSLSSLTKIEQGVSAAPSWWTIVAIARHLGVSLDLFAGAESPGDSESKAVPDPKKPKKK